MNVEAYRLALHALVRQKKFIIAILLSLLPAAAAGLVMLEEARSSSDEWQPLLTPLAGGAIVSAALPLTCLLLAGGMIADEAEERTLSYLLVRPVPRSTLYLSRALAVLTVALPLALLQVAGLWVMRWISLANYAPAGLQVPAGGQTYAATSLMWAILPALLGAAFVGAVFYCIVFGLVSIVSTRYHFFINLGYLGIWEAMLGHVPFAAQRLTATHYLSSILDHADPSARLVFGTTVSHPGFGIPLLLGIALLAGLASTVVVRVRDFHVTSAAT